MGPFFSGLFVIVYIGVIVAVVGYLLVLLNRMARSQERTADAIEAIARRSYAAGQPSAPIPPDESMAGVKAGEFKL
jgi:hypothetical protein